MASLRWLPFPRLRRISWCVLLGWMAVLLSGQAVVYSSHQCRLLNEELAQLQQDENRLEIAWGQNLLEESAQASLYRVERLARTKLGMDAPALEDIVLLK